MPDVCNWRTAAACVNWIDIEIYFSFECSLFNLYMVDYHIFIPSLVIVIIIIFIYLCAYLRSLDVHKPFPEIRRAYTKTDLEFFFTNEPLKN